MPNEPQSATSRLVVSRDIITNSDDYDPLVERIIFRRRVLVEDLLGDVTSRVDTGGEKLEKLLQQGDAVEMLVNPQTITVARRKVIQKQMTNNRWVYFNWGHEPMVLRYSGITGYMQIQQPNSLINHLPDNLANSSLQQVVDQSSTPNQYISPYETPAYRALAALKGFYEEPNLLQLDPSSASSQAVTEVVAKTLIEMEFRNEIFIGYFISFEIREEESSPWSWAYSMEFLADRVESGFTPSFDGVERNLRFIPDEAMNKALRGLFEDSSLPDAEGVDNIDVEDILGGVAV